MEPHARSLTLFLAGALPAGVLCLAACDNEDGKDLGPEARASAQAVFDERSSDHPIDVISVTRKEVTVERWNEWVVRDRAHPETTATVRANDHSYSGQEAGIVVASARRHLGLPEPTPYPGATTSPTTP